jgi:hypothetical protein
MKRLNNKLNNLNPTVLGTITNQLNQTIELIEHPTLGDEYPIIARYTDASGNVNTYATDFFDTADFYDDSEYNPIYIYGEMHCAFEIDLKGVI